MAIWNTEECHKGRSLRSHNKMVQKELTSMALLVKDRHCISGKIMNWQHLSSMHYVFKFYVMQLMHCLTCPSSPKFHHWESLRQRSSSWTARLTSLTPPGGSSSGHCFQVCIYCPTWSMKSNWHRMFMYMHYLPYPWASYICYVIHMFAGPPRRFESNWQRMEQTSERGSTVWWALTLLDHLPTVGICGW